MTFLRHLGYVAVVMGGFAAMRAALSAVLPALIEKAREAERERADAAIDALRDCANPMRMIEREAAKTGNKINGPEALRYCQNASNIKTIAEAALWRLDDLPKFRARTQPETQEPTQ